MNRFAFLVLLVLAWPAPANEKARPMKVDDLFRFKRVADPQISPDGKWVVYVVGTVDLPSNKTRRPSVARVHRQGRRRQAADRRRQERPPSALEPRRQVDPLRVEPLRRRQLWIIDLAGGEARQLTTISTEAAHRHLVARRQADRLRLRGLARVSPTSRSRKATRSTRRRKDEIEKNPVKAKVFTRLFFRHWDDYVEDKRQHLFVMSYDDGKAGEPRDVTPGDRDAYPTSTTFSIGDDFTFSPDGKYLFFTAVPEKDEAWSTNYDICRVPRRPAARRNGRR